MSNDAKEKFRAVDYEPLCASAVARLSASRERLRLQLKTADSKGIFSAVRPSNESKNLLEQSNFQSIYKLFVNAAMGWWARHPASTMVEVVQVSANGMLKPLAERHPVVLIAAAAGAGAVVFWTKPWKWILKPIGYAEIMLQLFPKMPSTEISTGWEHIFRKFLDQTNESSEKRTSDS